MFKTDRGCKLEKRVSHVSRLPSLRIHGGCENMGWTVYKHVTPDGRVYIGATSKTLADRWKGGYAGRFREAVKTYGWDGMEHVVIVEGLTFEEASERERAEIIAHCSTDPRYGYNTNAAGFAGHAQSEATRAKLSKQKMGVKRPPMTEEQRMRLSKALKGRRFTEEHRRHISEAQMGRKYTAETIAKISQSHLNQGGKCVIQIDMNGNEVARYPTAKQAERDTGTKAQTISSVCTGRRKTAGGYLWRHA